MLPTFKRDEPPQPGSSSSGPPGKPEKYHLPQQDIEAEKEKIRKQADAAIRDAEIEAERLVMKLQREMCAEQQNSELKAWNAINEQRIWVQMEEAQSEAKFRTAETQAANDIQVKELRVHTEYENFEPKPKGQLMN